MIHIALEWSADSSWLIVSDAPAGESLGLFLLSAEDGERRRLTTTPPRMPGIIQGLGLTGDWDPALSPDGRWLAFIRVVEFDGEVHRLRFSPDMTAQGSPERLTFEKRLAASPRWLSGGEEILLSDGAPFCERQMLRLAVPPESDPSARRQVGVGTDATTLAFSQASRRLIFSRSQRDTNIYRLGLREAGEPAGEPERMIASTRLEFTPEYSPDGDTVAFMSTRSGNQEIWLSNADGSNLRQLTSMGAASPSWSPDRATILFHSQLTGSRDIYRVGAQGGSPRRLTDQPSTEAEASWSRDGRWIYFGSDRTGRSEVWRMPAGGGQATQVTSNGGDCPSDSPDGRWLYYSRDTGARIDLWRAPVAGGAETRVLENLVYGYDYAVTSRGVYFIRAGPANIPTADTSLEYLDFTKGKIGLSLRRIRGLSLGLALSPDGRSLLYSQTDAAGADLILVENFR
jgi:Tol biopolymer transport system component